MKIHPVINNRSKDRFQFAPVPECTRAQKIDVRWFTRDTPVESWEGHVYNPKDFLFAHVVVDGEQLTHYGIKHLAHNNGFPSVEAFFSWFSEDFTGKIIHWTDLRY